MTAMARIPLAEVTLDDKGNILPDDSDWRCLWKRYRFQAFPHFPQTKHPAYAEPHRPPEPLTLIGFDFEGWYLALPL
jgi:hypothetical protein